MKENYYAYSILIFLAFFCFSAHSQPFSVDDEFVVWDCDGEGFIQPVIIISPVPLNAIKDSVGYTYPTDSIYTDFKFIFRFKDSLGNPLTIYHPVTGTTIYQFSYALNSLPTDVTHTKGSSINTLSFRLDAQYAQPSTGGSINVEYEVWGKNAKKENDYRLLLGQTSDAYYNHDFSCGSTSTPLLKKNKNKRLGNFEQNIAWIGPNPFQEYIYIETDPEESILNIRDIQGKLIREITLLPSEKRTRIKVGDLPEGLYLIQKISPTSSQNIRMIKSR